MKNWLFLVICLCVVLPQSAAAHVLDQYLQVALISLAPDCVQVELRLTPGVEVVKQVTALIDTDGNGKISPTEEQNYVGRILQDVALEVDGQRTSLLIKETDFPLPDDMNEGVGLIRLHLTANLPLDAKGEHQLTFSNDHQPEIGTYMLNTLIPLNEAIEITGQERDVLQHTIKVTFRTRSANLQINSVFCYSLLVFGVCLLLFLTQVKRLYKYYPERNL